MPRLKRDSNLNTSGVTRSNYSNLKGVQDDLNSIQDQLDAITGFTNTYTLVFDYATDGGENGVFKLNGNDYGTGEDNLVLEGMVAALEYVVQTANVNGLVEIEEGNEVFTIVVTSNRDFVLTLDTDVPNSYTFTKT